MRNLAPLLALTLAGALVAAPAAADDTRQPSRPAATPVPTLPAAGAQTLGPAGEGRRLYLKLNCYGCHGDRAAGGMGPNIAHAEFGDVSEAVTQGEDKGMRSYRSFVTSTDVNNLAAYLRSIGTSSEPTFKDWWLPVPPK